jgi:hypothetical protein
MSFLESGFLLVVLGAALLPDVVARASVLAAVAAGSAGLAIAALTAGATPLPAGFLAVDGALFVLAIVITLGSALLAGRERRGARVRIAVGALLAGAVGLGWGGRRAIVAAPKGALLLAAVVLAAVGAGFFLIGRLVRLPPAADEESPPRRLPAAAGLLAGAVATAAGPHLSVVLAGVIVAAWSGWLLRRGRGGSRLPLAPMLTLLLLPAWWLLAAIAGPEGLAVGTLPMLPISPAAEQLLAPILLVAAWSTAGLWPLHRQVPAALLAPVGALLLARVAVPAVPAGLEHWRPLAMPLIVLGIWHAALSGRLAAVAVGLAWVGLLGASRAGLTGAALLLAGALMLELATYSGERFRSWKPASRVVSALLAGVGSLLAIESGLHAEVVYTVLAVGGVVVAAGRVWPRSSGGRDLTP